MLSIVCAKVGEDLIPRKYMHFIIKMVLEFLQHMIVLYDLAYVILFFLFIG